MSCEKLHESITNFEASRSTELIRRHHNVRDQWFPTQGIKVQNKCAREKVAKIWIDILFRNQHDTLRISWNVVCKLVLIRFVQSVKSTFCTVSRGFTLGIVFQFPAKNHDERTVPKVHSQHHRRMTPTCCCYTINETLFERKCFQA